ncbi:hypothetical protein E5288_WYG005328 [Bos mutus]|uniref:Melanoma antigen preferentially expressed in tumors n=1 Tax=Bos mutus TaxID=72004 RepID=A0A6B0S8X0_9CETA|nr:hypothetical protein [Bos mutus]
MQNRWRAEAQVGLKPAWAPVQVLVDLCLKEDTLEQTLRYLLKRAKQRRSLLHLCCQKLRIITMPMQRIRGILKVVQLDSVQDLEVNCTWKLATLGRFLKTSLETLLITNCLISDFYSNPISMAMLESLLHHTMGLSELSHVLYPAALESYEDMCSTLHLGLLAQLLAGVKQLLCQSGRLSMVWFSTNPCPHCGDQVFYDTEPILCP